MSLGSTIKAIQDIMRKDAGVDGDAQRIGQLAWMLFLKIYSDLELETELEEIKNNKIYEVDDVHVVYHFSLEHSDYFMI